jgi:hypothetical protein
MICIQQNNYGDETSGMSLAGLCKGRKVTCTFFSENINGKGHVGANVK